ncbi:MAG TPA: MOSC N-terminal beta barrel domain-containing protein [Longimicrobiales bacterium]|nr:MOSC N-terminal beta barrel domain-containing protein [Longimicrobiales bacterium]
MHVSELYVYPIKSTRGIAVASAQLVERGFQLDRRWMLVDADGVFISQREAHRMALIDVAVRDEALHVSAPGMEPLTIPLRADGPLVRSRVWKDEVSAISVSTEADQWFSAFLERSCRLVYMPDSTERVVDRDYVADDRLVGFADAFPLLIIGQGSLDRLNQELQSRGEAAVPMRRFRPNIVIADARPHEEDEWREIVIGDVPVDVVKPCARCVVTTVDVSTGVAGREPLRTLARYRKRGSKVLFGQNAVHRAQKPIARGDAVRVVSRRG